MTKYQSQEFLFRRIKEILPPDMPMVDSIASILHITADSAYRRIRGETPLVLDEARELCNYFKLSLDHILDAQEGSTLFQNVRVNTHNYTYDVYLKGILNQMKDISSYNHKEIIYRTKDMPLFHNFYFEPLIAFRYFFWMKTIIQHPDFSGKDFTLNCVTREIIDLSLELSRLYN